MVFGAILMVNSLEKIRRKKKKKLEAFLEVLKTLDAEFNGEEKSLMMILERLLSFYRHSNWPRYAVRISRPIVARHVATRVEHGPRVLREQCLLKLRQTRGNASRMWTSHFKRTSL